MGGDGLDATRSQGVLQVHGGAAVASSQPHGYLHGPARVPSRSEHLHILLAHRVVGNGGVGETGGEVGGAISGQDEDEGNPGWERKDQGSEVHLSRVL